MIVAVGVPTDLQPNISERAFQRVVTRAARLLGWMTYHPPDNRPDARGRVQDVDAGWPDLVLVHPPTSRMLVRELKTRTGRVSEAQQAWHVALVAAGVDVDVWRPEDWPRIVATLTEHMRDARAA